MNLDGKTALVTGAAGALGAAICERLAADGANIIALDIDQTHLEKLAETTGATPICTDLGDPRSLETVIGELAPVDILVNNAGVLSNDKLEKQSLTDWHRIHRINLDAAFLLSQNALPKMVSRGWGRVINMSSWASKCGGLTAGTAYTTSKAALTGLTFSVAREYAGKGVTANAIAPAYVMSPMVSEQLCEDQRQHLLSEIPVGRFCSPEEVAHTVAFLASPLAGFITGEVIDMNGGLQFD
ncbi:SDR family NAD(P)-dependent oxidoreductase [Labrenzia sp. PHM005]|uniref:SDR family NAD(P)-dependent oxidoreductase n=1 Tax=Labrenzia sp. PHM005 TaxID=2590016 RepID=UPI0011407B64|nr:SDR family NAD(P)-dependent oxidoreductase [Labrenzia sp. PHM005]QDG76195.1 SDR family oxidoreductase [Labrenzia sp. PHM005]